MAKRVAKPQKPSEPGADDLQVLHTERSATIAGRVVVVREYGFIEGLGLRPLVQPFLDDLHAQIASGGVPELEQILVILGTHHETIQALVAKAADVEPEWVASLNQDDGYVLLILWWEVNGPFYFRSVLRRVLAEKATAALRAGRTSTPPSPPPGTETPTPSAE